MHRLFLILFTTYTLSYGTPTLMFIGDSLTAGYNLAIEDSFPTIIQNQLGTSNITIINAGTSGDNSFTLLNRIDFTIQTTPNAVFLCIGGNDGLRGIPPTITKRNINTIIKRLKKRGIFVILAGISIPKNYTESYIKSFETIFPEIAKKQDVPLMPFLLKDVAGIPTLNLTDQIHPNPLGNQIIAKNIIDFLKTNEIISSKNTLEIKSYKKKTPRNN